ncbi:MAG: hypothetical protein OXD31_07720, partial [Chloroflexi bacterium]|nr:hypothetical protein [Chloroflexota bacterium]
RALMSSGAAANAKMRSRLDQDSYGLPHPSTLALYHFPITQDSSLRCASFIMTEGGSISFG